MKKLFQISLFTIFGSFNLSLTGFFKGILIDLFQGYIFFLVFVLSSFFTTSATAAENSIHLDGTNDYVNCGNNASLQITGTTLTIEAWIYPTSFQPAVWQGNVINKSGAGDNGYMIRVGNSGQVNFNIGTGGGWNEVNSSTGAVTLNNWHHIAGTYDGTTMRLYVDGVQVGTRALGSNIGSASNSLLLGDDPGWPGRYFPGRIEEVRVWNTTRSAAEVVEDMNTMTCTPLPGGLVAYYRFNQGVTNGNNASLTNVVDETGTNNGTLINSALTGTSSNWVAGLVRACPANMTYVSSTASQPNTSTVGILSTNQEIIRIEIVTTGSSNPLDATQLLLRTDGTTNVADIANAKLWYTGTSSTFATTTQFGATIAVPPAPGVDMTFNGTQTLATGTNYFWLSYDVQAGATVGNVIDGTLQQITVDGSNETPTTSAPAGNRPIAITYCTSSAASFGDEEITNVTFGTINNTSACASLTGTQGVATGTADLYSDFSSSVAAPLITAGTTVPISVTITQCGAGTWSHQVNVYIDFNQNGILNDAGEEFVIWLLAGSGTHTINTNIAVPGGATTGNTRMRVVCQETAIGGPCTTASWGETEDYTVNIDPGSAMTYVSCTAAQPNTTDVAPSVTGQEVIRIEVVTSGATSPLDLTEIITRINGTTTNADIANAKLWYTGTSSTYATTTQFGATIASPPVAGVDMTFSGTQTLATGTNYFWLSYDVQAGATIGNVIDGTLQQITVDGSNETPTTSAPAGNRPIVVVYCTSSAANSGDEEITNVTFGTLNNTSACASLTGTQGVATGTADLYSDFSSSVAAPLITAGTTVPISVTITECGGTAYSHQVNVYIDFNQNGILNDAGEEFIIWAYASSNTHTINTNITVPGGATTGTTRMRVVCQETNITGPCTTASWGETEDYTVNIQTAGPMVYASSTTTQANTSNVFIGAQNQEIIGIQVVTTGVTSPFDLTQFQINMTGTTNTADVSNIDVYYTNTSSIFATTTLFGSVASGGGTLSVNGSQTLSSGTNYFWVVYDISATAIINNLVDAECTQITMNGGVGNQVPTQTSPVGSRPIVDVPGNSPCTAFSITVGCSGTKVTGDNTGMTNSGIAVPTCGAYAGGDVWFSLTVPASGIVKVEDYALTLTDLGMTVYSESGGCGGTLTEIACDDNSGFGNMSAIILTTQTPGNTLFVRVWDNNNDQTGTFEIDAADLSSDYCVTGDGTDLGGGCAELTAAVNDQLGSIWDADDKLDFTSDWTYDFTVNLGSDPGGADGICFVIQNDPAALGASGTSGGAMGAGGIINSLIVEIDTYTNTEDRNDGIVGVACAAGLEPDHLDIWLNGDVNPGGSSGCPAASGTRYIPNGERLVSGGSDYEIENGLDHTLRISYTSASQTLTATVLDATATTSYGTVSYSPVDPMVLFGTNAPYFGFTASTGGLSNLQTACLAASLVLPIELVKFDANCIDKKVELNWATATEINNDYFTIERSTDGVNFEKIVNVNGAGNSSNMLNYSWVDESPLNTIAYYRLKQTDFNGDFSYSDLLASNCQSDNNDIAIYPNPTNGMFSFDYISGANEYLEVEMYNMAGQLILKKEFNDLPIGASKNMVKIDGLSDGIYYVKFILPNKQIISKVSIVN